MSEMFYASIYAFGRWGPLLAELDPLGTNENPGETPAFRLGGENSPALTYGQTVRVMKLVAQGVVHDWEDFDYGRHSLRISRLNDFMSLKTTDGANTTDPMQDHDDLQSPMELQELETESQVHWSGQPTDRKSQSDMSKPPAAKRARMGSGVNKSMRRWDFRQNCFTTVPLPTVPIPAAAKRSSLCEDCQLKSRNCGLPGQPRRWCGTCANKHGGTLRCE